MSALRNKRGRSSLRSIDRLARELVRIKKHASQLGVFTNDRELLQCPQCGLAEDVTIDGLLITYRGNPRRPQDTGLRFAELNGQRFRCPSCGTVVKAVIL